MINRLNTNIKRQKIITGHFRKINATLDTDQNPQAKEPRLISKLEGQKGNRASINALRKDNDVKK